MFVNRERELEFLNKSYEEKGARFIIIYGKRRVGKTELVKQFFKHYKHIYFLADKAPEKDQLRVLSEKVGLLFQDDFLISRGFGNWFEFFKYVKGKGKLIIAIDEFPFLVEVNKAIPSIFQRGWDEELKASEIFLILLGSSIGMMETEVLGYKSPLFGRRTGQLLIEPLSYWDSKRFFPSISNEEFVYIFSILGGMPAYLLQFKESLDLWSNIKEKILSPGAYLFNEPEFILREELREPRNYFSILKAISMGKTRISEIINETGFEKNVVAKYLSVLTDLKIVKRDVPVTEELFEKSKKGIYLIDDNFFRFWFKFVFPNRSFIEEGEYDYVVEKKIKPSLESFVSYTFEEICKSFVKKGGIKELKFTKVGKWWLKDRAEIDIVAINEEENSILFGEAKWSTNKIGPEVLIDLKNKTKLVDWKRERRKEFYAIFSRSGFTEELKRIAEKENILLFEINDLNV